MEYLLLFFSHGDKSIFSPISLLKIKYETLFDSPIFIIFINNIVNCIFIKFEFDSLNFWKQVSKSKLVINQHNIKTKVDLTFDL